MYMKHGTIDAEGNVLFSGYVPSRWRVLQITDEHLVIHSPG